MFGLPDWLDAVVRGLVLGGLTLGVIVALVRVVGLRSFSKMTAFDFVITLATGSLLATGAGSVSSWPSLLQALVAIAVLMGLQVALAFIRKATGPSNSVLENAPLLLMRDGVFIDEAMEKSRVSRDDVLAKLRGANVMHFEEVRAVVLETTGDISVIHGPDMAPGLLDGVRGA
ncbi:MAG: YetF domain-containing protein [Pseudomonadota bacterium]|nr:YetF domain-containing protein [Pseudomonadota bacterium]